MSEVTDMTKEELLSSLDEHIKEVVFRYKDVWESYENLDEDYKRLQSRYNELKEDNEKLKQQGKEFSGYIELYSYGEGIKKGEQLMQEKVDKMLEFREHTKWDIIEDIFGTKTALVDFISNINEYYNKIINYEKEKEEKEKEIHVGDEVIDEDGCKFVVKYLDGEHIYVLASNGVAVECKYSDISKTGKHYPLEEILKELE